MSGVEYVAANVRALRKSLGLSARELGEKSGLPRNTIANLESGRKEDIPLGEVLALALALNVPPLALLSDGENRTEWFTGADPEILDAVQGLMDAAADARAKLEWLLA